MLTLLQVSLADAQFHLDGRMQTSLRRIEDFLWSSPLLSKLEVGEKLNLYLATSSEAVSSVLIQLEDKGIQKLIYYTNRVLHDAKTRHSKHEKIIYILIISMKHLKPYFHALSIVVLTDQAPKLFYNDQILLK